MPKNRARFLICFCAVLALNGALPAKLLAQTPAPGTAAKPNTTIPEKQHLGPVTQPKGGVIKPKHDTDPDMAKKPPPQSPGETPVIPPSATPGGNDAK